MMPIEIMLERVEWQALPHRPAGELPHATHSGVLQIGEFTFRCHRLNDGRAVIDSVDLNRFLEAML